MKILFITESQTTWWAFMNEIGILQENNECFLTESLSEAHKIVEQGIDKVVMFPVAISYLDYEIVSDKNLKFFAGYHFWKQDLAEKRIPTIVANIYDNDYPYINDAMANLSKEDWITDPHVTFLKQNMNYKELIKLIQS